MVYLDSNLLLLCRLVGFFLYHRECYLGLPCNICLCLFRCSLRFVGLIGTFLGIRRGLLRLIGLGRSILPRNNLHIYLRFGGCSLCILLFGSECEGRSWLELCMLVSEAKG